MSQGGESSFTVKIQGKERRPGKTRRCSLSAALDAGPSLVVLVVQNPPANARDAGSIPRWGRSHGGGHGNPLQYSCLENPRLLPQRSLAGCSPWGRTVRQA